MTMNRVLAYLTAMTLLLISTTLTLRRRHDASAEETIRSPSAPRHLKRSSNDRTSKSHHLDNLQTSWGTVRTKKVPLSSEMRKHDNSLKLERRERSKSTKGYKGEERSKSSKGEGKGGRSDGKGNKSKKGGKGKKNKNSKSEKECSIGKGKGKSKGKSSFQINCEDFDFLGLSSTPLSVSSAASLEGCPRNVLEQAYSLPELSTVVQLMAMADLTCIFHCGGPFTLLAPTNAAFEALNPEAMVELLRPENQVFLQELMLDHVLPGMHMSTDVSDGSIGTLLGESLSVETDPLAFGDSIVQTPDVIGCNGVLHIVGQVLIPTGDPSETTPPVNADQATSFPTPGRQPDAPIASPVDDPVASPVSATVSVPPPVAPPVVPPVAPPVTSPVALPVTPPIDPPVTPPVSPPVASPVSLPVAPPVSPPVADPVSPPVADPVSPPVAPPVSSPVAPPVTPPVPPPSEAPVDPPVAAPVATQAPSLEPIISTETPTANIAATAVPTEDPFLRIEARDIFIALVAPTATLTPRRSEFETFAQLTTTYFDEYLRAYFADDPDAMFVRVDSKLRLAKYGDDAGVPEEKYNLYVEFESITIVYDKDSDPPDAAETVQLLKGSITVDYLLNIPRTMTGTPFASTNEAFLSTI